MKSERAIAQPCPCHSFGKEQKSILLFVALFVKSKREICSLSLFLKEQKSDLLFVALFQGWAIALSLFPFFLKRASRSDLLFRSFQKELQGAIRSFALFKKSDKEQFALLRF